MKAALLSEPNAKEQKFYRRTPADVAKDLGQEDTKPDIALATSAGVLL
jgi:hypothetical protein